MDDVAAMPSVKGIMLCFDDFMKGTDDFRTKISRSRNVGRKGFGPRRELYPLSAYQSPGSQSEIIGANVSKMIRRMSETTKPETPL